jgi:hypothetical protein
MFCTKCGKCCKLQAPEMWCGTPLTVVDFSKSIEDVYVAPDVSDIKLNKSGCCEMLTKGNLCSLWLKFGREALPQGCKNFSQDDCRRINRVANRDN